MMMVILGMVQGLTLLVLKSKLNQLSTAKKKQIEMYRLGRERGAQIATIEMEKMGTKTNKLNTVLLEQEGELKLSRAALLMKERELEVLNEQIKYLKNKNRTTDSTMYPNLIKTGDSTYKTPMAILAEKLKKNESKRKKITKTTAKKAKTTKKNVKKAK